LFCAGWIAVITSLGAEYCVKEILHLYRSRWQIELLFKCFKQNLPITTIKPGSTNYAETETLLGLIIWTMTEQQVFLAECYLSRKEDGTEMYSTYEKCKVIFLQIKYVFCPSWSLFVNLSDKNIYVIYQRKNIGITIKMMNFI